MHDNRHTAASRLHREIGLRGVQEVLRHKQIETTRKYTHVNNEEPTTALQRAADKAAERQTAIWAAAGAGEDKLAEFGGQSGGQSVRGRGKNARRVKGVRMARPSAPQTSALTGLRYTPTGFSPLVSLEFLSRRRQPLGERKDDKNRQTGGKSDKSGGQSGGQSRAGSHFVPLPHFPPAQGGPPWR